MGQSLTEKIIYILHLVVFASFCIASGGAEAQPDGPGAGRQVEAQVMDTTEVGGVFSLERCIRIALAFLLQLFEGS